MVKRPKDEGPAWMTSVAPRPGWQLVGPGTWRYGDALAYVYAVRASIWWAAIGDKPGTDVAGAAKATEAGRNEAMEDVEGHLKKLTDRLLDARKYAPAQVRRQRVRSRPAVVTPALRQAEKRSNVRAR